MFPKIVGQHQDAATKQPGNLPPVKKILFLRTRALVLEQLEYSLLFCQWLEELLSNFHGVRLGNVQNKSRVLRKVFKGSFRLLFFWVQGISFGTCVE